SMYSNKITLKTFNKCNNHVLLSNTEEYSTKYQCIPKDILKEIHFFTENGNLPISIQRKLLKARFPTSSILNCALTNAIQKFKVKPDEVHDASNLLKTLIQNKSNDPGWFVEFQLNDENRLTRLFWSSGCLLVKSLFG